MKIFMIIAFMALLAAANSWEHQGKYYSAEHPGKCVSSDLVLSPGEKKQPKSGECVAIRCDKDDGTVTIFGCPMTDVNMPCSVGNAKHPKAPFPECCEKEIICPEGVTPKVTITDEMLGY